jgi:PAS domain-containing protein
MNYYAFLPLAGFFVSAMLIVYVLAQRRPGAESRDFVFFASAVAAWSFMSYLLWSPIDPDWVTPLLKINALGWLSAGVLFLNFTYTILGREKDLLLRFGFVAVVIAAGLALTTDWVIRGYTRCYWGQAAVDGPLMQPFALGITAAPLVYALWLIGRAARASDDPVLRAQMRLLLSGSSIVLITALTTDLLIPMLWGVQDMIELSAPATAIQALFIARAITRYDFLSVGVETAAQDLFASVHDGILIADSNGRVTQMNRSARVLFGLKNVEGTAIQAMTVGDLLSGGRADVPQDGDEVEIPVGDEVR